MNMQKKEIKYSFSIGYRCNSVQFLRRYNMSKFSGPFDWMYIDVDSSIQNIKNEFELYLNDIVLLNKSESLLNLIYPSKLSYIDLDILNFFNQDPIYMKHNYNNQLLPINQNFTKVNSNDIYNWSKICIFLHHQLDNESELDKIKKRILVFKEINSKFYEDTLLFYISKILIKEDIKNEIKRLTNLYLKLDKKYQFISILCCSDAEEKHYKFENFLFIIKNVPDYKTQFDLFETDNNFEWLDYGMIGINYDKEYDIIKTYYDFNLIEKEDI
jgi:hypothetical protein